MNDKDKRTIKMLDIIKTIKECAYQEEDAQALNYAIQAIEELAWLKAELEKVGVGGIEVRVKVLEKENERLRQGICEHVEQDIISGECRLCELAVAERGYKIWVDKAKALEQENSRSWRLRRIKELGEENEQLKQKLQRTEAMMEAELAQEKERADEKQTLGEEE